MRPGISVLISLVPYTMQGRGNNPLTFNIFISNIHKYLISLPSIYLNSHHVEFLYESFFCTCMAYRFTHCYVYNLRYDQMPLGGQNCMFTRCAGDLIPRSLSTWIWAPIPWYKLGKVLFEYLRIILTI